MVKKLWRSGDDIGSLTRRAIDSNLRLALGVTSTRDVSRGITLYAAILHSSRCVWGGKKECIYISGRMVVSINISLTLRLRTAIIFGIRTQIWP